jgi:hypothetical protein
MSYCKHALERNEFFIGSYSKPGYKRFKEEERQIM